MAKARIVVEYPDRPTYTVRIGAGLAAQLGADLRAAGVDSGRCLIICDSEASNRCLPILKPALEQAGFRVADIAIPAVDAEDAWACIGELHRALAQLNLPVGSPVIVNACVQVEELAAFAVSTYGGGYSLVLAPASLASAYRTVATDAIEVDVELPDPIVVPACPAFAVIDTGFLCCESDEELEFGFDELQMAVDYCDAEFVAWHAENAAALNAFDEESLILALTQTLAARADAFGQEIADRIQ
ncbi:MAG: hypothetical protein Q4C36_01325 [Coriobacteriia bacterium]|nr:hypothetical protein [Coriobacteriia bacterium]